MERRAFPGGIAISSAMACVWISPLPKTRSHNVSGVAGNWLIAIIAVRKESARK
jgi:hypothetical protein